MPNVDEWSAHIIRIAPLRASQIPNARVDVVYTMTVRNTGQIAGTVTEILDSIPREMEFIGANNGAAWERVGRDSSGREILSTRALEDVIIEPGEYANVELVLRWRNDDSNLGRISNSASIGEYWNVNGAVNVNEDRERGVAWILFTPPEGGETGMATMMAVIGAVVVILSSGVVLIKKYVLG